MDSIPFCLQGRQPGAIQHGGQWATRLMAPQQLALRLSRRKAQREPHREAIELGLRQRIGARLIRRVLGGDDEKRIGEGMSVPLDAHLTLGHRLQQGALHLGAGAVDLVRQQHLGEDGAGVKAKCLLLGVEDLQPQQVGGEQIGGELHPPACQPQHLRQRVGQGGFAHAGQILDQQMTARQQRHQRDFQLQRLAQNDSLQCRQQPGNLLFFFIPVIHIPCIASPLQLYARKGEGG